MLIKHTDMKQRGLNLNAVHSALNLFCIKMDPVKLVLMFVWGESWQRKTRTTALPWRDCSVTPSQDKDTTKTSATRVSLFKVKS